MIFIQIVFISIISIIIFLLVYYIWDYIYWKYNGYVEIYSIFGNKKFTNLA